MREPSSDPGRPTVLVLASTYPRWADDHEPGFVHELCKRLLPHFHVIALVPDAPGADPNGLLDGVEVVRYRYAPRPLQTLVFNGGIVTNLRRSLWKWALVPGFVLAQWWAARRILRQRRVDAIHAHWLIPQGLIARALRRSHGTPYLVTSHGGDLFGLRGALPSKIKRTVLRNASATTVVSTAMRDAIAGLGIDTSSVDVEPMGVDLIGRFRPDANVTRQSGQLLFVGRLVEKKGLRYLLEALPDIRKNRPDVTLIVAGFGPERQALEAQARSLGQGDAVHFIGPVSQSDLPHLYQRASIVVAPFVQAASGDQEGLGLVVVEALGCGANVVVSDLPATRELGEAISGLYRVPPANHKALSDAVLAALQALTTSADTRCADLMRFDWNIRAAAYADRLHSIIKQHRC